MNAVSRAEQARLEAPTVSFELNGRPVSGRADEPLIEVARREGIEIPHLCWTPGLEPAGNCRACVVEVNQERTLAAACCRKVEADMVVKTGSERARQSQKLVLELLQSDLPPATGAGRNEVSEWAARLGVGEPRRGNLRKAINDSANTVELVRNLFRLCDAEVASESSYVTMAIDMPQGLSEHFIELTEG